MSSLVPVMLWLIVACCADALTGIAAAPNISAARRTDFMLDSFRLVP
jgi:hypothetical protein